MIYEVNKNYDVQQHANTVGLENLRFLVELHPLEEILGFKFTSSNSKISVHECIVVESRYQLKNNYKMTLKSLVDGQEEHFYILDFNSLVRQGSIKIKNDIGSLV